MNVTTDCDEVGIAPYDDNTAPDNSDHKVLFGTDNGTQLVNLTLMNIMPVPATDYVDIQFNVSAGELTLEITDISGRTMSVQTLQAQQGVNNQRVMIYDYPAGIYMVSLKSGEAKVNGKFVKQ